MLDFLIVPVVERSCPIYPMTAIYEMEVETCFINSVEKGNKLVK